MTRSRRHRLELSASRSTLLEKMLREEGVGSAPPSERIERRPAGEATPLSFAQERMWFLDRLQPFSPVYNIPMVVPFTSPIDVEVLKRSLNEIVRRHESLRTTFVLRNGQPEQVAAPELVLGLPVRRCQGATPAEVRAEAERLVSLEVRRPFHLARGPLLRAEVVWLSDSEQWLTLVVHHIVADARSMEVLIGELAILYQAFAGRQASPLPELPIQYGDFARWQRRRLRGEALERLIGYWRDKLEGAPEMLELPIDQPRPANQTFAGALHTFTLPAEVGEKIKALSRGEQATSFMVLLAAFKALLHRYNGQGDVVVGTPISGRDRSELEGLIGLFLNTLVLRTRLSGETTFRRLVARARQTCVDAYAHQELPFEKLVEELQPHRSLDHSPLFQVLFVHQIAPNASGKGRAAEDAGSTQAGPDMSSGTAKFDLSLYLTDMGGQIQGGWEYNTDLFHDDVIARMAGHLETLLRAALAEPDRPLSELALLTPAERRQLEAWNETQRPYPAQRCPHELCEAQADETPDRTAVIFDDRAMTYREVEERANRLAHRLRGLGVGPEVPVGICVERSIDFVVGLLGILKAGGVHLPLDPDYPQERLDYMLTNSGARVLLTQARLADRLPADATRVLRLDRDRHEVENEPASRPPRLARPGNLGYLIYTSGSTGWPKGVGVSLRMLTNLTVWQNELTPAVRPGGRTLQFTSFSFDVSFLEVSSTLSSGGTLVMPSEDTRRDFGALTRLLAEREIERVFFPYTALRQIAAYLAERKPPALSLRHVTSTGEALHVTEPIAGFFRGVAGCRLHNEYGPTETHFVSAYTLPEEPGSWPHAPSIGSCIWNSEVRVLDRELHPVPIGVSGELYAGGLAMARGYHARPALTAERFLPNPFRAGERMYRTGDLARCLPDGRLEYLGRNDHQVKIRGFRIELGEIEATLHQHPALEDLAVVAREDGEGGDKRLLAFVVSKVDPAPGTTELRGFLLERLPDHMVPSVFVVLDELPLGPTGKVDRLRLPAADASRPSLSGAYAAPRSPMEEELANIWSEVLGIEKIGIHDEFFELGGHSLLAVQVINRINESFAVELPMRRLFEFPTVAQLAVAIVESQLEQVDAESVSELLGELGELSAEEALALLEEGRDVGDRRHP
jgi:amino acid adenylation domain-containing protein